MGLRGRHASSMRSQKVNQEEPGIGGAKRRRRPFGAAGGRTAAGEQWEEGDVGEKADRAAGGPWACPHTATGTAADVYEKVA